MGGASEVGGAWGGGATEPWGPAVLGGLEVEGLFRPDAGVSLSPSRFKVTRAAKRFLSAAALPVYRARIGEIGEDIA